MNKINFYLGAFMPNPFSQIKTITSPEAWELILIGRVNSLIKEGKSLDESLCSIANNSELNLELRLLASKTLTQDKF